MAQSTAGIKLYYGDSVVTEGVPAIPTTWVEIPDITGIPSMNSTPAKLETTKLSETVQKTYINGLMDLGGSFEFPANMTPELVDAVAVPAADPATGHAWGFKISFPAPLSTGYWWTGEIEPVRPGEGGVDAVATTTVYISQSTAIDEVDESGVS
jgi:hypothetical protein